MFDDMAVSTFWSRHRWRVQLSFSPGLFGGRYITSESGSFRRSILRQRFVSATRCGSCYHAYYRGDGYDDITHRVTRLLLSGTPGMSSASRAFRSTPLIGQSHTFLVTPCPRPLRNSRLFRNHETNHCNVRYRARKRMKC